MTCTARRYESARVARLEARRLSEYGEALRPYACPECGWHHVAPSSPSASWPAGALSARRSRWRARTLAELERLAAMLRGGR